MIKMNNKVLSIFVVISLILSVASFLFVILGGTSILPIISSQPSPTVISQRTPTTTSMPTATNSPTAIPSSSVLEVSYNESSREEIGTNSKVTITVNATYISGNGINIDYSQFYLQLYASRFIAHIPAGTTYSLNNGTLTLGVSHKTQIFQLTFEFSTDSFNGMDNTGTVYNLEYNGAASINWANQRY
jgi:hypothetical protein